MVIGHRKRFTEVVHLVYDLMDAANMATDNQDDPLIFDTLSSTSLTHGCTMMNTSLSLPLSLCLLLPIYQTLSVVLN